jgi:probable phosphoglycerate mutase
MGVWEEVTFGEVAHTQPEQLNLFNNDPEHWAVEGCETFETYTGRFLTAMQEAAEAHPGETIAIVAHGGVIRGVLQRLFFHDHADQAGHCDNTGVALLRYENGQYSLVYHNDNSHLSDEISTLARQHWWRKDTGQSYDSNLWFRPMGDNREEYLKFRHDAWMTVYGNDDGYAGVAYWRDAQAEAADAPNALVEAVLGDQVVGMVQLAPQRFAELGVGYIPFLYLVESARGRELGAQLLGHAVGFYRPLGRTKLQLAASQANAPALHFYEKHGFTPVGSVPGVHGDLLLLEKNIDLGQYGL